MPIAEALVFNYWTLIIKLLELGFPWDVIHNMESKEISLILGIHLAVEQRQAEAEASAQRQSGGTHFSHMRFR